MWPCSQYEAGSVRLLGLLVALIELTHPGEHADIAIDERQCPLLAQSGHHARRRECPLLGVKRTCRGHHRMSANDPKRTFDQLRQNPNEAVARDGQHPMQQLAVSRAASTRCPCRPCIGRFRMWNDQKSPVMLGCVPICHCTSCRARQGVLCELSRVAAGRQVADRLG